MFLKIIFMCLAVVSFSTQANATIDRFALVSPGIYRGAQPSEIADYQYLKSIGIKTIVNIRDDGAFEEQIAKQFGFIFYFSPMSAWSYPNDAQVNAILKTITDPRLQPVFVHCQFGKDRTGLISALHRVIYQGWKSDRAYNEMVTFGFNRIFVNLQAYYVKKTRLAPNPPKGSWQWWAQSDLGN